MSKPNWVVIKVEPQEDHHLLLEFADGSRRSYDARPLLDKPLYRPLNSIPVFMGAHVDGPTVVWTDMIDIAPETLYSNSVPIG